MKGAERGVVAGTVEGMGMCLYYGCWGNQQAKVKSVLERAMGWVKHAGFRSSWT